AERARRADGVDAPGVQRFRDPLKARGEDVPLGFPSPVVPPMSEVTRILNAIEQGDRQAASQLLPLVYEELRRLAAQKLARETPRASPARPRPGSRGRPGGWSAGESTAGTAAGFSPPPRPSPCAAPSWRVPAASAVTSTAATASDSNSILQPWRRPRRPRTC